MSRLMNFQLSNTNLKISKDFNEHFESDRILFSKMSNIYSFNLISEFFATVHQKD